MSTPLRYGLPCVWPSAIADQFYCEYKVHLANEHPEVRPWLPALVLGDEGHAALEAEAVPISEAEVQQAVRDGKTLAVCEWALEASLDGVPVRGRPDLIHFQGHDAQLLLDFKFGDPSHRPFLNQIVQLEVYALLLEGVGFRIDDLVMGVVRLPRPAEGFEGKDAFLAGLAHSGTLPALHRQAMLERAALLDRGWRERSVPGAGWTTYLYRFDRVQAQRHLGWALPFWRGQREPEPERERPNKCRACPYNAVHLCPHALADADPAFRIQPLPDGQILVTRAPR